MQRLRMRYVAHLDYLDVLLSTGHLAARSCRVDWVVGTLPGLSTFAHPEVMNRFLTECDVLSALSSLEDIPPDLNKFIQLLSIK